MRAITAKACVVSVERCILLNTERAQLLVHATHPIRCGFTLHVVFALDSDANMHLAGSLLALQQEHAVTSTSKRPITFHEVSKFHVKVWLWVG